MNGNLLAARSASYLAIPASNQWKLRKKMLGLKGDKSMVSISEKGYKELESHTKGDQVADNEDGVPTGGVSKVANAARKPSPRIEGQGSEEEEVRLLKGEAKVDSLPLGTEGLELSNWRLVSNASDGEAARIIVGWDPVCNKTRGLELHSKLSWCVSVKTMDSDRGLQCYFEGHRQ
ncbi:hypothetical protein OIU79_002617 [Salix purpurea]|uniref:Uncharacterized protein n=1 Tax=Salix purpurea TaxID=77065 RepID=A0A9Q0UJY4_SALPP|nr:hypothetical protein OIU79_002617 [Salix purpurea]